MLNSLERRLFSEGVAGAAQTSCSSFTLPVRSIQPITQTLMKRSASSLVCVSVSVMSPQPGHFCLVCVHVHVVYVSQF